MRVGGEPTFLAIADVSGYTSYLAGVELDHATDILADLIGTVVDAMVPFRLSKLEGDAAFASLEGETDRGVDPPGLHRGHVPRLPDDAFATSRRRRDANATPASSSRAST